MKLFDFCSIYCICWLAFILYFDFKAFLPTGNSAFTSTKHFSKIRRTEFKWKRQR